MYSSSFDKSFNNEKNNNNTNRNKSTLNELDEKTLSHGEDTLFLHDS